MQEYFLESARIGFRCWSEEDFPIAMQLWGDPEVTGLIGGPSTPEMVRERLKKEIRQFQESQLQYWPIFLKDGGENLGCAGLRPYQASGRIFEFGVHLRRSYWRRGLAKEAGAAVIDHAFRALHADALFAGHHPANGASRQLLLSLGFRHSHEEPFEPTGLMHPSYFLQPEMI